MQSLLGLRRYPSSTPRFSRPMAFYKFSRNVHISYGFCLYLFRIFFSKLKKIPLLFPNPASLSRDPLRRDCTSFASKIYPPIIPCVTFIRHLHANFLFFRLSPPFPILPDHLFSHNNERPEDRQCECAKLFQGGIRDRMVNRECFPGCGATGWTFPLQGEFNCQSTEFSEEGKICFRALFGGNGKKT
jgi:hypothetical protein